MDWLSSISSWVKKIVQPVVSTITSWFTPTTTTKTTIPTVTPTTTTPKVTTITPSTTTVAPVAGRTTAQLAGLQTQPVTPQKSIFDTISSWLTPATSTPTPTSIAPPVSQVGVQQPTTWETLKSWFTPQQPTQVETWQPAKDVFGQSQQGQSLLGSIQDWLGSHKAALQGGVSPVAQAQIPAVGQLENVTAEEWAKMGRPSGGTYPELGPMAEAKTGLPAYIPPGVYKKEDKPWWEGGTQLVVPTPEQLNTPEYVQGYFNTLFDPGTHPELYDGGKLNTVGEAASENFWDAFTSDAKDGYYTPEQMSKDPQMGESLVTEMLMRDKYDQKWVETLPDASLGRVITQVASQDPTKLPPTISQERLDATVRGPDFATLYDIGYRSQTYQNEAISTIRQLQSTGVPVIFYPDALNNLTYANIEGLKSNLNQITPAEWQKIIENGGQVALKTEFWKFNAKGESINKGSWNIDYPPQSAMTQSEQQRYISQQQFYNDWYWSDEATVQRQKERDESYAYSQEKDNEGWASYYATLDSMKLYPDANDYWSQPGKFAELRRKWETSGGGQSWETWLASYDFEGEWYALPPTARGEKKYIYSPRMIRLNY